ncbi:monovalent cation:proton antiporter-2 (CPA2) family protein [Limnobacter humi]|uniref:Monovalent cation:proton antiporter-2 (CPA2) family protein n=1 Tax=Limnobacter humi TaxID=1778671 RepID=A0ABT1WL13_9BURK|nr:monovalent cation:proton antiporter-2 (CPA2) family protein [Limnobacter humi]
MPNALELSLILMLVAVLAVSLFKHWKLPAMLGYLFAGTLIGPFSLGFVPDVPETRHLAEFGVVFLMFSIGLEFSLPKLHAMRRVVFGLGLAQVSLTILGVMALGWLLNWIFNVSMATAFVLAGAAAMSSTAIVSKLLAERLELDSAHGRQIMGILLFQDLAVVPLLIIIPALAEDASHLPQTLSLAMVKAALVLGLMLVFGQRMMNWWMTFVARSKSQELFVLNVLLITLGLAWLTELAELSLALGAFVAGILIAETQYKHQVEEDIKPFRDVLLGLFFVTTGMLLNPAVVVTNWYWVILLSVVPVIAKLVLIAALAKIFGANTGTAMRTGIYLAQAGEFGFVLLSNAGSTGFGLVPDPWLQTITASMVLSMLAAPFMIQHADRIVLRFSSQEWLQRSLELHQIAQKSLSTSKHVLVCGFGRSGQHLARLLDREDLSYVALDLDPDRIREATAAGDSVVFGDAAKRETLVAAGLLRASCVVVTFAETKTAEKVLMAVRQLAPAVPVIVRTTDESDLERLTAAGATEVVPEILEGSLMLGSQALMLLGVPVSRVVKQIRNIRESRYQMFRGVFRGVDDESDTPENQWVRLHSVIIEPGATGVGRSLAELGLMDLGVEVNAIRRRGIRGGDPSPDTRLESGDILVLKGQPDALSLAESKILGRKPGRQDA